MTRLHRYAAPLSAMLLVIFAAQANLQPAGAQVEALTPISIVGSEAVFPLAVAAGERFSERSGNAMPVVERNGTARGFELFCTDIGPRHPDIATAERRMTRLELSACNRKRIAVSEVKIGFQGVALAQAQAGAPLGLSRRQIFLALARQVPIDGKLVSNPYRLWSDIDFALPVKPIAVFGPPPTSPLYDAFVELMMLSAANDFPELRGWSAEQRATLAGALRDDGVFTELGENENTVAAQLARRPQALGIVSYNFLAAQDGVLRGVAIDGVAPRLAAIADGRYAPSRPLYLYVKTAQTRIKPDLQGFLAEITGASASGPGGYLTPRGLVPLPPPERAAAGTLTPLRK